MPENVIPIASSAKSIPCRLRDDSIIWISRNQPMILPNFAMTDFGSQGRTRLDNVVNLRHPRDHLAVYTALSRAPTLDGTLILSMFDTRLVCKGMVRGLRRELRELEILDDVTRMRFTGTLPPLLHGVTRSDVIHAYYKHFGLWHVPVGVHPAVSWANAPAREIQPPMAFAKWSLVSDSVPVQQKRPADKEPILIAKRIKAGHQSDHATGLLTPPDVRLPPGFVWDSQNWSCAYDSLLTILYNVVDDLSDESMTCFRESTLLTNLLERFTRFRSGNLSPHPTLEDIRDAFRDEISAIDSALPRAGSELTSIAAVIDCAFVPTTPFAVDCFTCDLCGDLSQPTPRRSFIWTAGFDILFNPSGCSVSQVFAQFFTPAQKHRCPTCQLPQAYYSEVRILLPPPCIFLELSANRPQPEKLAVDTHLLCPYLDGFIQYRLVGVVYLGGAHFTAIHVRRDGSVWYHDGLATGDHCVPHYEPYSNMGVAYGRGACILLYARTD